MSSSHVQRQASAILVRAGLCYMSLRVSGSDGSNGAGREVRRGARYVSHVGHHISRLKAWQMMRHAPSATCPDYPARMS